MKRSILLGITLGLLLLRSGTAAEFTLVKSDDGVTVNVDGNLMTHMNPASQKLRERGLRIVMAMGGLDRDSAVKLLEECEGNVAEATRALQAQRR